MSRDWMFTRVMVLTVAIVGPVYFFILMFLLPFQMQPFMDPLYDALFHYVLAPAVFSAPWVGFIYNSRYRLSNSIQLMGDTTSTVPLRWRVFYGSNAAFVMAFFVLPLIAAPLAVVGGLVVAGHLFYRVGIGKMGGGKAASAFGIIVAIALCILPAIVTIQFIPEYIAIWESILVAWSSFWFIVVYGFAQCLVNALSFGAPVYFIYFAAQQYDKGVYGTVYTTTPTRWIRIAELLIFVIFLYFYLPDIPTPFGIIDLADMSFLFTSYINWISLSIVVIMILVKRGLGVSDSSTLGGPANMLIVGMFLVIELFFKTNLLIVTLTIWLAFLLFAGVIVANFIRASPREMY